MKHLIAAALLAVTACAPNAAPAPTPAPAIGGMDDARLAQGQALFEAVCSTCHSVDPPPRTAPPMSHIARHYRTAEPDSARAVTRVAAWLTAPSPDRSALPAHAIQRFGLMPALQLGDEQATAVAEYVLSLGREHGTHRGGHRR